MRFEPRLIRHDEADDSSDLPDDLAELAEQLGADAEYLAARYPAPGGNPPAIGEDWGRRFLRGAAAAIVLCSIGLLGGRLWRSAVAPTQSVGNPAVVRVLDAPADRDRHTGKLAPNEVASSGNVPPVVSLSGREQGNTLARPEEQSPVALGPTTRGSIGPQLKRGILEHDPIDFDRHVGEVGFNSSAPAARVDIAGDELEMLKIQLLAFEKVIVRLQAELQRRAAEQAETEQLVESLRRQVESLRQEESEKPATGDTRD